MFVESSRGVTHNLHEKHSIHLAHEGGANVLRRLGDGHADLVVPLTSQPHALVQHPSLFTLKSSGMSPCSPSASHSLLGA